MTRAPWGAGDCPPSKRRRGSPACSSPWSVADVSLCAFWSWDIKGHATLTLFAGLPAFGALSCHVRIPVPRATMLEKPGGGGCFSGQSHCLREAVGWTQPLSRPRRRARRVIRLSCTLQTSPATRFNQGVTLVDAMSNRRTTQLILPAFVTYETTSYNKMGVWKPLCFVVACYVVR